MHRIFLFCLFLLLFAGGNSLIAEETEATPRDDIERGFQEIEMLSRVMETIRQNYVDPEKVSYPALMAAAMRGMLSELDPHSQFLSPQLFEELKESGEATYEGVGITITPGPEGLVIVSVREEGPAARAGVLPGDRIVKLGEDETARLNYLECVQRLKGQPGETLNLTRFRPSTGETAAVSMVREVMRQDTVRDIMLLDPVLTGTLKIGYARLVQFNATSPRELADALDQLEDRGMEGFVLDLRNNPGGLLTAAVEVLGEFLPPETIVVTTEGRPGAAKTEPFRTPGRQRRVRSWPLTVLVNQHSASASELVSGALQDLKRAVIVGTVTFGKGSVQSIIPTDRGSAVRLTTAYYFTPSHNMIHGKGITPDLVSSLSPGEEKQLFESFRDRALNKPDPAALAKIPDPQLKSAITVLEGLMPRPDKAPPAKK